VPESPADHLASQFIRRQSARKRHKLSKLVKVTLVWPSPFIDRRQHAKRQAHSVQALFHKTDCTPLRNDPTRERKIIMTCTFCKEANCLDTCDWLVERFIAVPYGSLKVGDLVRKYGEERNRQPARVVDVSEIDVTCWITLEIRGREKRFTVWARSLVMAIRSAPCAPVCCERHRADRGPGAVCCTNHWNAWMGIAA
jgi:hypothetical protein